MLMASAAAHGRKEGDFVAGVERGVPGGEFLIARGDYGGAIFREFGNLTCVGAEELFNGGVGWEIDAVFLEAGEIFEAAKEEDFDADGLGGGWHKSIVTSASARG
jgi:hypothetical protein